MSKWRFREGKWLDKNHIIRIFGSQSYLLPVDLATMKKDRLVKFRLASWFRKRVSTWRNQFKVCQHGESGKQKWNVCDGRDSSSSSSIYNSEPPKQGGRVMTMGPENLISVFTSAGGFRWSILVGDRVDSKSLLFIHGSQVAHLGAWEDRCRAGEGQLCMRGEGDGPW